jgi:hypothetical protein
LDVINGNVFPADPHDVFAAVATAYGLTGDDLRSLRRWPPLPDARRVLYALLHDDCRLGWARIAEMMGRQRGSTSYLAKMAGQANPHAVELLRERLRPPEQGQLW